MNYKYFSGFPGKMALWACPVCVSGGGNMCCADLELVYVGDDIRICQFYG